MQLRGLRFWVENALMIYGVQGEGRGSEELVKCIIVGSGGSFRVMKYTHEIRKEREEGRWGGGYCICRS